MIEAQIAALSMLKGCKLISNESCGKICGGNGSDLAECCQPRYTSHIDSTTYIFAFTKGNIVSKKSIKGAGSLSFETTLL
jgi:hypothetical protein